MSEPVYSMREAIEKIVSGLNLKWRDGRAIGVRVHREFVATGIGRSYRIFEFIGGSVVCGVHKQLYKPCESIAAAKQRCLDDYRIHAKQELEQAATQ